MNAEQAHEALLLMDEADTLIRWASVSHPDPEVYKKSSDAFWKVCRMLAEVRGGGAATPK